MIVDSITVKVHALACHYVRINLNSVTLYQPRQQGQDAKAMKHRGPGHQNRPLLRLGEKGLPSDIAIVPDVRQGVNTAHAATHKRPDERRLVDLPGVALRYAYQSHVQ